MRPALLLSAALAAIPAALSAAPPAVGVPSSVYAPPPIFTPEQGVNQGGVTLQIDVTYYTDYVFRGIKRFSDAETGASEDSANLQPFGKVSFDLGKLPSPFVSVFANVATDDQVSNFEEIRPTVGFDWDLRLFQVSAGHTSYVFPSRNERETNEIFASLTLNDAAVFNTERPILSPFVFAAYDYDRFDGLYLEGGLRHDFEVENTGLTVTVEGVVAYVNHYGLLAGPPDATGNAQDTGFPFYQLGLIGRYDLNALLNLSTRYGEFALTGYLYYTDGIDDSLRADTQLWGGAGISFRY